MIVRWLNGVNLALAAIVAGLIFGAAGLFIARPSTPVPETLPQQQIVLPKNAFRLPENAYQTTTSPALALSFSPLNAQLPDLRKQLIFYGKNSRPDAQDERQPLYFAFNGNKTPTPLAPGQRLYILYDKYLNPPQYLFLLTTKRRRYG